MIQVTSLENDRPIIKRLKTSLNKSFKANSESDIDSAVKLANFLVACERIDEAKALLESFLYFQYSDKEERYAHVWPANTQGLVLLSYIADLTNNPTRKEEIISAVVADDYHHSESETHFQKLLYDYRNHEWYSGYYHQETHKYRCDILSQQCLTFLYWRQTWDKVLYLEAQRFDDEFEKIDGILSTTYELLREEISSGK